jgi:hypothetical protein
MKKSGKRAGRGRPRKMSDAATLSELGITRDQSSQWQKLADIPDEEFEAALRQPGRKLSTAGILAAARRRPTSGPGTGNVGQDCLDHNTGSYDTLLAQVEDFRFKHRFESRKEATRWLLKAALDAKLVPKGE